MKRHLTAFTILFFAVTQQSSACEICGCGVGNYYIGLLPQFRSHFIGLRYHYNKFSTRLVSDPTQYSKDFYQSIELWSGWNIGKKFQLLALVPLNFNHQESDEGVTNLKGPGDVVLLMNYRLFDVNSKTGAGKDINQQLWLGGGIKLPTGKFEIEANDPDVASMANMQLGSGTTDILLNGMYNIRVGKIGVTTQANYKISGTNKDEFRFGNKFSASSFISYGLNVKAATISPNLGLLFENTAESKLQSSKVDLTSDSLLQGALGVEFGFNTISVGLNTQLPFAQNFAENQTKQKVKAMVHISFVL
jgi:hypothetical protein